MTKITAIIPTLNEEENVAKALDSVAFADEIIVIDSFSTDKTLEIAKSYNATIIQREFDDFSSQKNYAISQAKNEWIFLLDADEIANEALQKEVVEKANNPEGYVGFFIYRNFYFKNKRLKYSGWQHDRVVRLFNKNHCKYEGKVHERIVSPEKIGFLEGEIQHYSLKDVSSYKDKLSFYASLQAEELYEKNKIVTPYHIIIKPLARFFIQYFVKLGFLDGYYGFIICKLHAFGVSMRYKRLIQLKKNKQKETDYLEGSSLIIGYDAKRIFHNRTGLGNYGRDLIRIMSKHFSDNYYYLFNTKQKTVNRLKAKKNIVEFLPKSFFSRKFSSLWRMLYIVGRLKKENVKLYHGLSGEIPFGLRSRKIKSIVTIHDLIFLRYPQFYSFIDRSIYYWKFKYSIKNSNRIIAISEQTKKDIISFFDVSANKIDVVYQGCHKAFKKHHSNEYLESVRETYNLPENYILNVGTIEERKNLLTLVKAIKGTSYKLVVVGKKTSYFNRVNNYIIENHLENQVLFFEGLTLDELSVFYRLSYVFVYPSLFEGFGIPIIEALYSRVPVITSKDGCFSEAGGSYSLYVNPKDANEIRDKIMLLYKEKVLRNEIANKSHVFVQKFNDDFIATNIMDVYKKTLFS